MSTVITPAEANRNFSENLRAGCQRLELTQGDVARAIRAKGEDLQVTRNKVSRFFNGTFSRIDPSDLANIAALLETTVDDLLAKPKKKS